MALREELQESLGTAYTIDRELGGGGMSRVFLAEETRFGRKVVVKVLAPELAAGINAERFEREIKTVATLQQANIVPLLTAGETGGLPYFTMPYVEGQSLRARLASGPRLGVPECVSILRDVARALGYAHERGVVHRDIKPDNVLLSRGAAEVTDFGIAKALVAARTRPDAETLTQLGTSIGTPAYMSPEQAAGDPNVDGRADLYALGCMAHEMLSGKPPFSGTPAQVMAAHINTSPPPIVRDDVPPELKRTITKCLAKLPADRYRSADELLADLDAAATPSGAHPSSARPSPGRAVAWIAGVAAIAALAWFGTSSIRSHRWVRIEAIPRIKDQVERGQTDSAWMLARQAQTIAPNDSVLESLWPRFARKVVLHSTPEGAKLYRATFEDTSHWEYLGTTPTDTLQLPIRLGRLRVEKPGYRTLVGLTGVTRYILQPLSAPDSDMAMIPGGSFGAFLVGSEGIPDLALGDYLMDIHEVTNRQYKAFVDAGGYSKPELWPAGANVASYRDKTGRPGPATWEAGSFPAEQADFPVGGVSWYEAQAYAKFVHKSLPTIYHWARAANVFQARFVVPGSNFDSNGPVRGGASAGVTMFGVFDMAGNVREWCENSAGGGERFILGGGWSDAPYQFTDAYAQPATNRAAINGIRLVKYLKDDAVLAKSREPAPRAFRDYKKEKPASAAEYEAMRHVFDYDRTALNARVESRDTTDDDYVLERVSFDAAYGNERMFANVYIPKRGKPPYQATVMFPGSNVISVASSVGRRDPTTGFLPKSGRVLVIPILKSTFERRDSLHSDVSDSSIFWRDHVVMWVKDMRRTLDYLSTRVDMDSTKFAYFGYSWGSNMAPPVLAVESRFKVAVLYVAGLTMEGSRGEVDPFNYLPRVKQPVLMLNGRYDFFFPVEVAQRPFFQAIGTAATDKTWKIYEGGHDVPRTELIAETLKWLDKYLGSVQ